MAPNALIFVCKEKAIVTRRLRRELSRTKTEGREGNKENMNMNKNTELVEEALQFAMRAHEGQVRKDELGRPYIVHPLRVKELIETVAKANDEATLCAALLHDTLEDTPTTVEELRENFGEQIASIVVELTDDKSLEKKVRKGLQIEIAKSLSKEASLIRLADKIANVEDIINFPPNDWSKERKAEYIAWAGLVVESVNYPNEGLLRMFNEITG